MCRLLASIVLVSLAIACLLQPVAEMASPMGSSPHGQEERPFRFTVSLMNIDGRGPTLTAVLELSVLSTVKDPEGLPCELSVASGEAREELSMSLVPVEEREVEIKGVFRYEGRLQLELRPYGPEELYPHDAYLLNLSFTFEDGGLAREDLLSLSVACDEALWRARGSLRLVRHSPMASVVIEVVLTRLSWLLSPYYLVLLVSSVLLGASLLISPTELASRLGLYLSMLFSLISMLGLLGSRAPQARATSLGECLLLDLCVTACLFCIESVLESLAHGRLGPRAYTWAQAGLKLSFALASLSIFILHFWFFTALTGPYPWTGVPLLDFLLPSGPVTILAVLASYNEAAKATRPSG